VSFQGKLTPAPVAIITAVEAEGWAHWTVVESIDADTLACRLGQAEECAAERGEYSEGE